MSIKEESKKRKGEPEGMNPARQKNEWESIS